MDMPHKVMVVDDNVDTCKLVGDILTHEGYQVVCVQSGEECLKRLKKERPELVLLDIMMPQMSGWDTFEKIKKTYDMHGWNMYEKIRDRGGTAMKVAFMTVIEASEERKKLLKQWGIADYITKPFETKDLIKRVKKIIDSAMAFFLLS